MSLEETNEMLRIVESEPFAYHCNGKCFVIQQLLGMRKQTIGNTVLECDTFTVTTNGEVLSLPQKEFMLLYKMASYPGRIFTRQQLMDEIWGYGNESDPHTVDVHIGRLRDRFRDNKDFKIVTMRGVGYKVVKL